MSLSIEQIRACHQSLAREEVAVPDLDGTIWGRALTLKEVTDIQVFQKRYKDEPTKVSAKVFEIAACNEDGSPMFVGEDKKLIETLPWSVIEAVSEVVLRLSKLTKVKDDEAGKD